MQQSNGNNDAVDSPLARHRAILSIDTTASGAANSAISVNGMVTEESLRLSHFPQPPTVIPSSPHASERGTPSGTPTRSHFTPTPPITPRRKADSRFQPSPNDSPRVPLRKSSDDSSVATSKRNGSGSPKMKPKRKGSNDPSRASSRRKGSADLFEMHSQPKAPRDSRRPKTQEGGSDDLNETNTSSTSLPGVVSPRPTIPSIPPFPSNPPGAQSGRSSPSTLSAGVTSSPYSWHDGSSGIVVDAIEDRMLSTSFITGLLASTQSASEDNIRSGSRYRASDAVSEMTYPPPSSFVTRMQSPGHPRPPPLPSSVQHTQSSRMPQAFPLKRMAVDSEGSEDHHQVSVVSAEDKGTNGDPSTVNQFSTHSGYKEPGVGQDEGRPSHGIVMSGSNDSSDSVAYTPALPSTTNPDVRFLHNIRARRGIQPSLHSTKSTKTYVSSFISGISQARLAVINRFRVKPLPPVPTVPLASTENGHQREKRYHSENSPFPMSGDGKEVSAQDWQYRLDNPSTPWNGSPKRRVRLKLRIAIGLGILLILGLIGVVVGITLGKKRKNQASSNCTGNTTGAACTLDATCVCTSLQSGRCDELAQSLISLTPTLNRLFRTNFTTNIISSAIWQAQGAPFGGNCAPQAKLIDVAPALDINKTPNRTTWAQTALLWNLVESQDVKAVQKMQSFISTASWNDLGASDGPLSTSTAFQLSMSGFVFDFASQTVSQPNVSFASNGNPSSDQLSRIGGNALSSLDRMYGYALASSSQREQAMSMYWRTVLFQKPEDWQVFVSAVVSSPILLPFDATSSPGNQPVSNLLGNTSSSSFPPPLGCYPGLDASQLEQINTVEVSVFGLPSTSAATQFDPSCFPNRPVYGVIDILRLRLPFIDSRSGVPKQAAVLKPDVGPRGTIHSGEAMSALSSTTAPANLTMAQTDPRQYGTLNHLNHVLLDYLSSIPDVNVANALVQFVLSKSTVPPTKDSVLFQSLASIPTLEVAIFGSINPTDISSTVSSLSTPSGSLFFGSDEALTVRQWAINSTSSSVEWTELATSPLIVRDSSLSDSTFNSVWDPASTYLHSHPAGVTVDVSNITNAFQATGKLSP